MQPVLKSRRRSTPTIAPLLSDSLGDAAILAGHAIWNPSHYEWVIFHRTGHHFQGIYIYNTMSEFAGVLIVPSPRRPCSDDRPRHKSNTFYARDRPK